MYIFLIIWFLFLFVYIIFNVYGLYRVMAMRIKGDATPFVVLLYVISMFIIIAISVFAISRLDWDRSLGSLIGF